MAQGIPPPWAGSLRGSVQSKTQIPDEGKMSAALWGRRCPQGFHMRSQDRKFLHVGMAILTSCW